MTVLDVYDSMKPWPEGTAIKALRVWQILPLSVAPCPRNTGLQVPGTGSVNCAHLLSRIPRRMIVSWVAMNEKSPI